MSSKKEVEGLVKFLRGAGVEVKDVGRRYKAYIPGMETPLILAKTGSDWRGYRNAVAQLKRVGIQYPPPSKKELRSQRRKGQGND